MKYFIAFIAIIAVVKLLVGNGSSSSVRSSTTSSDDLGSDPSPHISHGVLYDPERPWTSSDFIGEASSDN